MADGGIFEVDLEGDLKRWRGIEPGEGGADSDPEYWIRLRAGLYRTAVESGVEPEGEGNRNQDRNPVGWPETGQGTDDGPEKTADYGEEQRIGR